MSEAQSASPPVRPCDQWHCGNGHLKDQALLRIILRNGISDAATMEFIDDTLCGAGPEFAASYALDEVPF